MATLINRQMQIPNGLKFFQPETNWTPPPNASFDVIVNSLIAHRNANPFLRDKHGWATDYPTVANEVDAFNARICESHGWTKYITSGGGGPAPKSWPLPQPQPFQGVRNVVAGAKTLIEWRGAGGQAVPAEQSGRRAEICSVCEQNGSTDLLSFFTQNVAEAIKLEIELKNQMKLQTPYDEKLGVCKACDCPMKLKVHTPIDHIKHHMPEAQRAKLDPKCWILAETNT